MHLFILLFFIYHLETTTSTELKAAVDLTWPFNNETIYWNNAQPFAFSKKIAEVRIDGAWYASNDFCAGEHGGTHFDAPYHFNKHGWKVGDIPLSNLIVKGVMIDLTKEVKENHHQARLLPHHLDDWIKQHGQLPDNCVLLIRFGWSQHYNNKYRYLGIDSQHNLNFPGVSRAAAEWIVKSHKVVGVGVDTASVDPGRESNFHAHKILSASQIYVLENLKIPLDFPEDGYVLYVMPMKIADGTGAPLRLIAVPFKTGVIPPHLSTESIPWYDYIIVIFSISTLYVLYAPIAID